MERRKNEAVKFLHHGRSYQWIMWALAFLLTVFCISTGSYIQKKDAVLVGSVAAKRYVSPVDTVDEAATERLKEAAADSVTPVYKKDRSVESGTRKEINDTFEELNSLLLASETGKGDFYQKVKKAPLTLPVTFTERQLSAYRALDAGQRVVYAEECTAVMKRLYEKGIMADGLTKAKEQVRIYVSATEWGKELKEMGNIILSAAMKPNLLPDDEAIEAAKEAKREEVSDVLIRKNQKIVDEGEIITEDIYNTLQDLGLIGSADYVGSILPLFGSLLIVLMIFVSVLLFFMWGKGRTVLKKNEVRMLFVIYIIMVLWLRVTANIPYFTLVPMGLFAMLVSLLIGRRVAILMNCLFCIIGCFIFSGNAEFLIYALLSGTLGALLIQKTEKRKYLVPVAVGMAFVNFLAMLATGLFYEDGYTTELLIKSILGAVVGLISVMIAIGSLPFWEAGFEANTPFRLMELTNPNNELLRRLMIEAPGTYHHSLIVANLAETAVYELGGNTALARAGAYYHDIGKLKDPRYFAENQSGSNPHDQLDPKASALIITQHPKTGVEIGLGYGLPKVILDIIREHHGTSLVKFFYFKALKQYGAENVSEEDYRYHGNIPSSRESAVVMLADTVEAAVRSMLGSGKTLEEAEAAIKNLIKDKLDDGQLNQSGLAIDELETIRLAFLKVFQGMYHERVAYPDQKDIDKAAHQEKKAGPPKEETPQKEEQKQ